MEHTRSTLADAAANCFPKSKLQEEHVEVVPPLCRPKGTTLVVPVDETKLITVGACVDGSCVLGTTIIIISGAAAEEEEEVEHEEDDASFCCLFLRASPTESFMLTSR